MQEVCTDLRDRFGLKPTRFVAVATHPSCRTQVEEAASKLGWSMAEDAEALWADEVPVLCGPADTLSQTSMANWMGGLGSKPITVMPINNPNEWLKRTLAGPRWRVPDQDVVSFLAPAMEAPWNFGSADWGNTRILGYAGSQSQNAIDAARNANVLHIMAHGRDNALWLNGALVCGRTVDPSGYLHAQTVPSCMIDGQCFNPEYQRLSAQDIAAPITYVNSCSTLKPGGGKYPSGFDVATALYNGGAFALVSSPIVVEGRLFFNVLFHTCLRLGMTVFESAWVVNQTVEKLGIDTPRLVVMGRPDVGLPSTMTVPLERLSCPSIAAEPGFYAAVDDSGGWWRAQTRLDGWHYQIRLQSQQTLLFGLAPAQTMKLEPIEEESGFTNAVDHVQRIQSFVEAAGWRETKLESQLSQARNFARRWLPMAERETFELMSNHEEVKRQRALQRLDEVVLNFLAKKTHDSNLRFSEIYRRAYRISGNHRAEPCSYCGGPVEKRELEPRILGLTGRTIWLCYNCGVVLDRDIDSDLVITIEMASTTSEEGRIQVAAPQWSNKPIGVSLAVVMGARYGVKASADHNQLLLDASGVGEVPFSLDYDPTARPHQYWLRAYVTDGSGLAAGGRVFDGSSRQKAVTG